MDEEHTITLNLGSSPDPLIDPILSPPMLPPSRVKPRAQPAARLLSIARSPRKRTFELDIGSPVSPQRLLVTVQAEDEVRNTKGIKRRLFQSPTPTPKRGVMRGGDVTTTVVPVRGLSDDEGVTPRRRGRPRKSGTPVPTTRRKRPGTPGAKAAGRGTSRSPRKSPQKEPPPDEDALEHIEATPRPVSLLKRPAKRKSMTPAKEDSQPRKRGRPRKSQVPAEMNMGSIAEILQQDNASRIPPIQHDFFGQGQYTTGEDQGDDGAADMEDDLWLGTLSSPAAQRLRTSLSNRSPPKEPSPSPAPEPEPEPEPETEPYPEPEQQPQPEHSEGDFDEQGEWGDLHDGPEDDYDEGDYMTSPVRDVGDGQDTMAAGAEDFTEVPLAELRSMMNSSMMAGQEPQEEEELGDATKVIIKNGIDYLRQSRGTAAGESALEAVQETREEDDFRFSVGHGRTSRLEPAEPGKPFDFGSSFRPGQSTQEAPVRRRAEPAFNSSVGPGQAAPSSHAEQLKGLDFSNNVGSGPTTRQSPTPPRNTFDFDFSVLPGETNETSAAERRSESPFDYSVGPREARAAERAAVPRREVVGFGSSIGPVQRVETSSFEAKSKPFDPEFFSDESREPSEEPRQGSEELRQESEEPRRHSQEPRHESQEPRHESEEPRQGFKDPGQGFEEPAQQERYSRSRVDPSFEFSDEPVQQTEPDQHEQSESQWAETTGYSAPEQQNSLAHPEQEADLEQGKPSKRPYKRLPPRPSEVEIDAGAGGEAEDEPADDSDAWWNRVPEKPKPIKKPKSLLGKLIRKAARQRTDSANTTQEPSPADDSNLSGEGDSFSTLPDEVYAAATPGQKLEPQFEEEHVDEIRDGEREEESDNDGEEQKAQAASHPIQPSIERPSPVNHSNPHLDTNRLLTPDETPSPIPSEGEGDGVDEDAGTNVPNQPAQPDVQVEMPSSPPASDPSLPAPVAHLPQHTRTKSNETPADQLSDVAPLPRTDLNVQSLNLAPPGSQPRPSLSPIVRAGRVLQLVTSDPPSPPGRDSVLRSPFRGSFEKSSQSPAPFISQPRATRSPSPQRTDTAQEKQPDRPWLRGLQQIKNFVAETAKSLSPTRISNSRPDLEEDPEETPSRRGSARETRFGGPEVDPEATVSAPNSAVDEPVQRRGVRSPQEFAPREQVEPVRTNSFGFRGSFTSSRNRGATDRRLQQEATRLPAKEPTPQPEPEPFSMDDVNAQEPAQPTQEEEDDADFWLEAGGVTPFAPRVAPPPIKAPVVESRQSSKIPTLGRSINSQQQRDGKENQLRSSRNSQIDDADEIEEESSSILEQLDKRPAVKPTPAPARTNLSGFFSSPVLFPGQETPGMGLFKPSRREPTANLVQQQQKERKKVRQPDNSLFAHLVEMEEQEGQSVVSETVPEKQPRFDNSSRNVDLLSGAQDDAAERQDAGSKEKERDRGRRSTSARAQEIMEKRLARIAEAQKKAKEQMSAAATSQPSISQPSVSQPSASQPSASHPSAYPSASQPSTSQANNRTEQENTSLKAKGKEPERPTISAPRPPSPIEPQENPDKIPQLRNFAPRRREFGENTLFQPQAEPTKEAVPITAKVLNPDNSQVDRFFQQSRQLIEPQNTRRQRVRGENARQISAEVFSSPKTTPPRHQPNREASPAKSSFRSPLKGKTPGPVVEFTSSTLSPLPRERRAKSPKKTKQSQSQKRGVDIAEQTGGNKRREELEVNYPELPTTQPADAEGEGEETYDVEREGDPFSDTPQQRKERQVREQQDREVWKAKELGPALHYGNASFEQRLHQARAQESGQKPRGTTWEEYGRPVEEQPSELDWEAIGEQEPGQDSYEGDGDDRDQEPTPPLSTQDQRRYEPYQPRQRDYQQRNLEPVEEELYSDEEEQDVSYEHEEEYHQQGNSFEEDDYDQGDYDQDDYSQEDDHDHQQGHYNQDDHQPHHHEEEEEEEPQTFFPKFSLPSFPTLPSLPNPLSLLPSIFSSTTTTTTTTSSDSPPPDPLKGWSIPNWELLDHCLTLHRQHRLPILPLSDVCKSYVGLVPRIGEPQEAMTVEVWHLQIVEYYKRVILPERGEEDHWTEWELVRMLFAVLIGEMRRRDRKGMEERRKKREEDVRRLREERERKKKRRGWFNLGGVWGGGGGGKKKYKVEKPRRKQRSRR
ncbi:hypothetical protein QBC41DRAFT_378320 [Cercophora samala]|uniref:Uncharacterized protein n=1 Tax=Cercophora samala TaxID=330535 RepID=A0AA39ZNX2_9PEZI|nr:hypothetical protein QBC41DRAFT_378320 [Cercophora samala]